MRLLVKVFYDGRYFEGYARQPGKETIEQHIIDALIDCGYIRTAKESRFQSASRTDPGVSAISQVICFTTNRTTFYIMEVNDRLPPQITLWSYTRVPQDFNLRRAITYRFYKYFKKYEGEDISSMSEAARLLIGYHDFRYLCIVDKRKPVTKTKVYRVAVKHIRILDLLVFDFVGRFFLNKMIRKCVSALEMVGKHLLSIDEFRKVIDSEVRPKVSIPSAPASGLVLVDIGLPIRFRFTISRQALKRIRRYLKTTVQELWSCTSTLSYIYDMMLDVSSSVGHIY